MSTENSNLENVIAVIGMAGRFPGAHDIGQYWHNLCAGIDSISRFSNEELKKAGISDELLNNPSYVKARGIVEGIELFDADFFGLSAKEAEVTDPQHRLFLETAWQTLENAGYCPDKYAGIIGVYGGSGTSSYFLHNIHPNQKLKQTLGEYLLHVGNEKDFLATKVAYKLNLKGPSLTIQTACSTSLVVLCTACDHLLTYRCDMALAGSVSLFVPQESGYIHQDEMIYSPDGYCRPFDANAQGTVPANGVGMVLLKRLQDAIKDRDHIYAVIKGYGINNDGNAKIGYSAPSVEGQSDAIVSAINMADINPETITYVEAHATGTKLGDPIEMKALTQAFQMYTLKNHFCSIGSVKGNVGHLIETSGIAGFIKTCLTLDHCLIPPTIHFDTPNPYIDFSSSPFYVATELKEWKEDIRRAAVSSFGIGGTNAHMILQEKPHVVASPKTRNFQFLPLSAKTPAALEEMVANFTLFLQQNPTVSIEDAAYTLKVGRKEFPYRAVITIDNFDISTSSVIKAAEGASHVVFIIRGSSGKDCSKESELYQNEPCYQNALDDCFKLFAPSTEVDLYKVLSPKDQEEVVYAEKYISQKSIGAKLAFATKYAHGRLWLEWGITPQAIYSDGVGKLVAACLSDCITLDDAAKLLQLYDAFLESGDDKALCDALKAIHGSSCWIDYPSGKNCEFDSLKFWKEVTAQEMSPSSECIFVELGSQENDLKTMLTTLAKLWLAGIGIDWQGFYKNEQRYRLALPSYPFERKRYWIDPPSNSCISSISEEKPKCPQENIEEYLLALWKDLLGFDSIGIHDDFFNLGGDSVLSIQAISTIKSHFGISLNNQSLLENPTIKQLSALIAKSLKALESKIEQSSILVKLRSGDESLPPLFLIHPIEGYVFCYKSLAQNLTYAGPVYGIQSPYCPFSSIEEIAAYYIESIQKISPQGPYYLLGTSFGGLLAFEIASKLSEKNHQVAFLGMIDIVRPEYGRPKTQDDLHLLANLLELFEGSAISIDELEKLSEKEKMQRLTQTMKLSALEPVEQQKIFNQIKIHLRSFAKYKARPYPGKIVFFEAAKRYFRHEESLGQGWKEMALGGIDIYEIPGNHADITNAANALQLAQLINSYIGK